MTEGYEGNSKKIAFIHPDLGIGGAERLVVDSAMGLQDLNYNVSIFTSHCDKSHCFEEVSSGKLRVKVYGDFLPTSIRKKLHIVFAILRQLYLVLKLIITQEIEQFDFFIVDQLSFCVPFLIQFSRRDCKIMFYCHFPDQMLSKKEGFIKMLYRIPFNFIEEWTTGLSDCIIVNSNFTKSIFHKTFKRLRNVEPEVIYPCIDVNSTDLNEEEVRKVVDVKTFFKGTLYFLSINRFERTKNIELAIEAFAKFKKLIPLTKKPVLVIAGGYDSRVTENVEYLNELIKISDNLKLTNFTIRGKLIVMPPSTDVLFLPSISTSLKKALIKNTEMLLYTPCSEHFGIVPLEGMLFKIPVLGVNHGGPLETIVNYDGMNLDSATGFIQEPNSHYWAKIMIEYFLELNTEIKTQLGQNAYERAIKVFLREEMSKAFASSLSRCEESSSDKGILFNLIRLWKIEIVLLFSIIAYKLIY